MQSSLLKYNKIVWDGGCETVSRVVTSNTRRPAFIFSHQQYFYNRYLGTYLLLTNWLENMHVIENESWKSPFLIFLKSIGLFWKSGHIPSLNVNVVDSNLVTAEFSVFGSPCLDKTSVTILVDLFAFWATLQSRWQQFFCPNHPHC